MRVGIVLDESLDGTDGVQQYVLRLTEWLRAQKHEVYYLVGETVRTDVPNIYSLSKNLRVRFNGNKLSTPLPASRARLEMLLTELQLDILHVQAPYSPYLAGRLIKLARKVSPQTAIVGTFHILPYSRVATVANHALGFLNRSTARKFDRMIAVSQPAADFAKRAYDFECQVVPNCFDMPQFIEAKSKARTKQVVFLGRLVERKGPLELLRAVAWLVDRKQWPAGWRVVLGGKGGLLEVLQDYIEEEGLQDIVSFAGFVPEEEKAAFLAKADIAVFPSTAGESFGISLLEAMAAARGVVLGGDNPGYRSVMQGFEQQLCMPRETVEFAALLLRWMTSPAEREAAAKAQRAHVAQYDAPVVGSSVVAVYEAALQNHR